MKVVKRKKLDDGTEIYINDVGHVIPDNDVYEAAVSGDIEMILSFLTAEFDVNKYQDGDTLLTLAAKNDQIEVVALLLSKGAEVNKPNENGFSPLMYVARNGNYKLANLLLNNGADVNYKDKDGYGAFTVAVSYDYHKIARLLMKKKFKMDVNNPANLLGLYFAVMNNDLSLLRKMISLNFAVNAMVKGFGTPLFVAIETKNVEIIQYLMDVGAKVNIPSEDGHTALIAAATEDSTVIVKRLIAAGADIDQVGSNGVTPIFRALTQGHYDVMDILVNAGCRLDVKMEGISLLGYALYKKDLRAVKKVLLTGIVFDINDYDYDLRPMIYAAQKQIIVDQQSTNMISQLMVNRLSYFSRMNPNVTSEILHMAADCEVTSDQIISAQSVRPY